MRTYILPQFIPWVIYTDPELAAVGYSEKQLRVDKVKYSAVNVDFSGNDRAKTELQFFGKIKVFVGSNGIILGVTILGHNAGELIFPWVILMQNKMKIGSLTRVIAPYPTFSDIHKRVVSEFYKDKVFNDKMRWIVKMLMGFKK